MNELKPCPFCGSEAVISSCIRWVKSTRKRRKARGVYYCIGCTDPDCILYLDAKAKSARLMFSTRSEGLAIRRWNRRKGEGK